MANSFSLTQIIERRGPDLVGVLPAWNIVSFHGLSSDSRFLSAFLQSPRSRKRIACPDLAEAESELVAGFHTEYSSFKFAMFFIGRVHEHDYSVRALLDSLFLRLEFALSCTLDDHGVFAERHPISVWPVGIYDGIKYETIFGRIILPGSARLCRHWRQHSLFFRQPTNTSGPVLATL